MKFSRLATSPLAFLPATVAQSGWAPVTDSNGIKFWTTTWASRVGTGNTQFGLALPPANAAAFTNEYIGRIVAPAPASGTWFGLSHLSGMTGALMLLAWPDGDSVVSSFRYASGYVEPDVYTGNASLSVIESFVNATHFGLT
jgi:cellobiose dehydrogenase (acceptor)